MININIENMYIGSVQVEKCYLGDKQIWPLGGKTKMTWDTTKISSFFGQLSQDDEILLPLTPDGTYNFDVVYQGNVIKTITDYQDNLVQFPDGQGVKEIEIVGQLEGFRFFDGAAPFGDAAKLIAINSVGDDFKLMDHSYIFALTENLVILPKDWMIGITTTLGMFLASSFNGDISGWDVSSVTNMASMFDGGPFNQDISGWDVSSVTNMASMFNATTDFNQDISGWDVSSVTNMDGMFQQSSFTGDISGWDVSSVTNMRQMFYLSQFNGDISGWDVSSVTNMASMFNATTDFNQDLSSWCVSQISTKPNGFDNNTPQWTKPKPIWGTCPQ